MPSESPKSVRSIGPCNVFPLPLRRYLARLLVAAGVLLGAASWSHAIEVDSFTAPYQDIDVAAGDMGIIQSIAIKEGERVTAGQRLAGLEAAVLEATLEIAKSAMESRGRLESATEEWKLQSEMLVKLEELHRRQHASRQEVERAQAQVRISAASLKAVREEYQVKALEYERARVQLERRQLRSPIDGIVTRIFKDQGEFVSPSDPVILKIVQLDPLLVVFLVPAKSVQQLSVDQTVDVRIGTTEITECIVEFVSPTPDPQSGTTRVRVRIPNPKELLPSGAACRLILHDELGPFPGLADQAPNVRGR